MRPNAINGAIGNKLEEKRDINDRNDLKILFESSTKTSYVSTPTPQNFYKFQDLHKKNSNLTKLADRKLLQVQIKCFTKYL